MTNPLIILITLLLSCLSASSLKTEFIQIDDKKEGPKSAMDIFFNFDAADMRNFDFFGNEFSRPDRTLPKNHYFCRRQSNISDLFRRFAGLLMAESGPEALSDISSSGYWGFCRITELMRRYYGDLKQEKEGILPSSKRSFDEVALDIEMDRIKAVESFNFLPGLEFSFSETSNAHKLKKMFPILFQDDDRCDDIEKSSMTELFIVDLLYLSLPNLKGSLLESFKDVSGMLLLLFLVKVEDLTGYSSDFIDFYRLLQKFAGGDCSFELPSMSDDKVYCEMELDKKGLLEELFKLAVKSSLPYTLELFFQLGLLDFGSTSLMEFILRETMCLVILNRLMDFIPWNGVTKSVKPLLHHLYENYPERLPLLLEYEEARVDWNIGEVGEGGGRTLLGRILSSISTAAFEDLGSNEDYSVTPRDLLKSLLREQRLSLISRVPDRDLMDECMDGESEGIKMLANYLDSLPYLDFSILADFIKRILESWKTKKCDFEGVIPHTKLFIFLLKKCECECVDKVIPVLREAFEMLRDSQKIIKVRNVSSGGLSVPNTSSGSLNGRQSSTDSRTFRSDIRSSFTSLLSFDLRRSQSYSPPLLIIPSPRRNAKLDLLRVLVDESERIVGEECECRDAREMVSEWRFYVCSQGS